MAEFGHILTALREQMQANLSRSDVLRALFWPMSALMTATLGLVVAKADFWLLLMFASLLVANIVLYGASFVFCLLKDRDALRSERYSIQKLAIEHGVYGDSRTGLIDVTPTKASIADQQSTSTPETAQ